MARPRAADYEAHRAQILSAAAGVFARRGYTAATMNEVASAAGVSKATLYHYFGDKGDLLEHIASAQVQRLAQVVDAVVARGLAPPEHLRALIEAFMKAYADAQNDHRVLTEDVKFLDAAAQARVLDAERAVVAAFASAVGAVRPELDAALRTPVAMLLFGMLNWTFTWLKPGGRLSHEALGPMAADLFFGGLPAVQA